jgi:hypothetical protein
LSPSIANHQRFESLSPTVMIISRATSFILVIHCKSVSKALEQSSPSSLC